MGLSFPCHSDPNDLSISNPEEAPFDPQSKEFFLHPPSYREVLLHFIGTAGTIQKAPDGVDMAARHEGGSHPCTHTLQTPTAPRCLPQTNFPSMERVPYFLPT